MTDFRDVLERELERLAPPRIDPGRLSLRRERKIRNQRVAAAIVAIAVSLLAAAGLIEAFTRDAPTGDRTFEYPGADISYVDVRSGSSEGLPRSITTNPVIDDIQVSPDGSTLAFQGGESARVGIKRQIYLANIDGSDVRRITSDETIEALHPRWSPDGTRIVFEGSDGRSVDLFEVDARTGSVTRITVGLVAAYPRVDLHPTYTPDGRSIVYTASRGQQPPRFALKKISLDSGERSLLMSDAALGSYAPDGRSIAFRPVHIGIFDSFAFSGVSFADPDGSHRRKGALGMGAASPVSSSSWFAEWSPDGTRLAYTDPTTAAGDRRLFVFDPSSGRRLWLGLAVGGVTWLDDDTLIVRGYEARLDPSTPTPPPTPSEDAGGVESTLADLRYVDLATGRGSTLPRSITSMPGIQDVQVSPDRSMLAFEVSTEPDGLRQVYVANIDGSGIRQLSDDTWQTFHPSWSFDGTRIVYEGLTRSGVFRIYTVAVGPGTDPPELLLTWADEPRPYPPYAAMPRFSPDGTKILFAKRTHGSIGLWTMPVEGGSADLFIGGAAFGSYSPDGRSIVYRHAGTMPGLQTGISFFGDVVPPAGKQSGTFPMGAFSGVDLLGAHDAMPLWSPDGRRVLYTDPFDDDPLFVFDVVSGQRRTIGRATEASWFDDDTLIVLDYEPR